MTTVTIPRKLANKGDLVLIPRKEYEQFLKLQKRLLWEEKDTDEAIRIFKKEKSAGKLKSVNSFSEILK